ncbi:MAG: hypothetical protein JSU04_16190 [Bdellovibrionales bacterium]|nr:hypothetical protein [Bdellovibrionales bacterium]
MKTFMAISLLSILGLWSFVAGAEQHPMVAPAAGVAIVADNAGQCPYGYKEVPTYKWSKSEHRWVYVGYTCYPSGGY